MSDRFVVKPYTEDWVEGVKALNERLNKGGLEKSLQFPASHIPMHPPYPQARLYQDYYLITEEPKLVRGGFILTHEEWYVGGEPQWVAHLRLPLSEGAVNRDLKAVGGLVFEAAAERQPFEYTIGMGGFNSPVARRLKSLGWTEYAVPFYFRVFHGYRFLRNMQPLRKKNWQRIAADIAAYTGTGALGLRILQGLRTRGNAAWRDVQTTVVDSFGAWVDTIWEKNRARYWVIAPRDSATLNRRYPAAERRYLRLRIDYRGEPRGWAIVLDTQMAGNKYFGNARVGAIADALAAPEDAWMVVEGATRFLQARGVDLVVGNLADHRWGAALERAGFLSGPSNYVFGASPKLSEKLVPFEEHKAEFFLTRGDGAGPERLME